MNSWSNLKIKNKIMTKTKTVPCCRNKMLPPFCLFLLFLCALQPAASTPTEPSLAPNGPGGPQPQIFLREPTDQTAIQGTHVTLPCRVKNKKGMLQWTRDGFGLGIVRNLTGFDRYHMSGVDEEGRSSIGTKGKKSHSLLNLSLLFFQKSNCN